MTADNKTLTVVKPWQQRQSTTTTYNFEVANDHTYFVTDQQIWTHNACLGDIARVAGVDNVQVGKITLNHAGVPVEYKRIEVFVNSDITDDSILTLLTNINGYNNVHFNKIRRGLPSKSQFFDTSLAAPSKVGTPQVIEVIASARTVRRIRNTSLRNLGAGYVSEVAAYQNGAKRIRVVAHEPHEAFKLDNYIE